VVADHQGGGNQAGRLNALVPVARDNGARQGGNVTKLMIAVAAILWVGAAASAQAPGYPNRPITVVVPFPAGGPTDAIIRNLGERMRESLGQPLVVEYATGAGGTVGTARAARAAPDGYTIICGHVGTHVTNGAVYNLPYDLVKDFAPISLLPRNPYLIVTRKTMPANDLREFIAYLKANPDKVNMGHPGAGTTPHLVAMQLAERAGSRMNYIPYRGAAPAMVDLLAGQIDLMVDQVQNSLVHVRAGSIKALAIASPTRNAQVPGIPTVDEAGAPGLHMSLWYGFWAPAHTPKEVIARLNAAVVDALGDPAVRARLTGLGMEIPLREQQTPEALLAQQKADIEKWWPIIRAAGIKPQ
jgi:tripartite-type tricarboxylate transporter receptor subunit TctC